MTDEKKATFTIDGVEYDAISDDLSLDEATWFYKLAGVGIESLGEPAVGDKTSKMKALMILAIARAKPEVEHDAIEKRVGALKLTELQDVFKGMPDVDNAFASFGEQSPPPEPPSESEPAEPSEPSGDPGSTDSDDSPAESEQAPTGSPPSGTDTPAPDSDPATLASLRRVS